MSSPYFHICSTRAELADLARHTNAPESVHSGAVLMPVIRLSKSFGSRVCRDIPLPAGRQTSNQIKNPAPSAGPIRPLTTGRIRAMLGYFYPVFVADLTSTYRQPRRAFA